MKEGLYRPNAGIIIFNKEGKLLWCKRRSGDGWQFPQGGIDEKEIPEDAVWREMMEEIGTNKAKIIKVSDKWINYQIPNDTLKTLPWGKKYIGQTQKWFAFEFTGKNDDINVKTENPEFSEWKWAQLDSIIDNIVPFKRDVYTKILEEFKDLF